MLIACQVCAGVLGRAPETVEGKYGEAVKVDRTSVQSGSVLCTYSNRVVAGATIEPTVSFSRLAESDPWESDMISYRVVSTNALSGKQVMDLLADIDQGDWVTETVPAPLNKLQARRYSCYRRRRTGGESKYDQVARGVRTVDPVYITINYVRPAPDPAIALEQDLEDYRKIINSTVYQ